MRKAYKNVMSLAVVLIAGLNFIAPAFAQDPFTAIAVGGLTGASGAGLFGSMAAASGIDIGWSASGSDPMDAMWNVLNPDNVYFSGEKHEADPQTDPEDLYDYIKVDIGDWLGAQSDFIVKYAQEHGVTDNSSGTTNITQSYAGYPFQYSYNGTLYGPTCMSMGVGGFSIGSITVNVQEDGNFYKLLITINNVTNTFYASKSQAGQRIVLYTNANQNSVGVGRLDSSNVLYTITSGNVNKNTADTVPWQSSVVNTGVFDNWGSAKVKIPHSMSQLSAGWTLADFLEELDRIWTGAGEDNIIIEDGDTPGPVPPVPVPDTPLGQVPFDDWVDLWGQGIYQQLENQSDALDLIGSNGEDAIEDLESIDSNLDDLNQTAESIDTNIGIGNGILGGIRSLAQSAVDYLESIVENVSELVEEIVEGTETLISGILNQIPQAFGVIFGPIKQASSIWHYVVEWIQSIGAPFQFIWSMASGTSYYIILPVYASLAAAVVLAFYKRFGK